jgi:transcriptional regulator with GAF, ATPase, and Fis domain
VGCVPAGGRVEHARPLALPEAVRRQGAHVAPITRRDFARDVRRSRQGRSTDRESQIRTMLESAQCDTIIQALYESRGNRYKAAGMLGIARSSCTASWTRSASATSHESGAATRRMATPGCVRVSSAK